MRLKEDAVELPSGHRMDYAWVERGPAVIIVPVTSEGQMVLVRQFRYPAGEECLEVPAGTARDAGDLTLEQVAGKELKEEVGGTWQSVEHLGSFFSNSSLSDEECHVFLAVGVDLGADPEREASEEMHRILLPVAEAVAHATTGAMHTGPAALAVLMAVPRLRELGWL